MKLKKEVKVTFTNSYYIPLPKMIKEALELEVGSKLLMEVEGNKITLTIKKEK